MTKPVLEAALQAEMTVRLGYEKHQPPTMGVPAVETKNTGVTVRCVDLSRSHR